MPCSWSHAGTYGSTSSSSARTKPLSRRMLQHGCSSALSSVACGSQGGRLIHSLYRKDWVVYGKPAFGNPVHVQHYLAAIPIVSPFPKSPIGVFRWRAGYLPMEGLRPRRPEKRKTLSAVEFQRRFFLHATAASFSPVYRKCLGGPQQGLASSWYFSAAKTFPIKPSGNPEVMQSRTGRVVRPFRLSLFFV